MAQHQYYCEECGKHLFDNKGMFRDSDDAIMLWFLED